MRRMMVVPLALAALWLAPPSANALGAGRPMTVDDLLAVKGVSDPQVSPTGGLIVYVVSEIDRATGKSNSDLYLVGQVTEPRRLTSLPGVDNHPRWSPDGKTIAFNSTRSGSLQVWLLPVEDGGEARQLTKLPIDASGPVWSPDGRTIAVAGEVYPGLTPEATAAKDEVKAKDKSTARVFDDLMIRHWDHWDDGKRSHIFAVDVATGAARDLMPNLRANSPPAPFGGSTDYTFAPDSQSVVFTAEPTVDMAWTTNTDLWQVPVAGGEAKNLTADNKGADAQPAFSPEGRTLAWLSQAREGFEADQWVLKVQDLPSGRIRELTAALDRPVQAFGWLDPDYLVATIDDRGAEPLVGIALDSDERKPRTPPTRLVPGGVNTAPSLLPAQPNRGSAGGVAFLHASARGPSEVYYLSSAAARFEPLTHHNDALLASLDLNPAEAFTAKGADGDDVSGWLVRPPGFDPAKKYPVVFLIHGGPQGAWHDEWAARWNMQLFAAPGYAVVALNPRGSTGYGQKFTDQVSQDWTGRVYQDLMLGLDHALKTYPFLDGSRMAAAGGSYGGFMVNWIAGHSDRFRALISHAGVYNLTEMYGTTEELWFADWEFGGPPWRSPKLYLSQNPGAFAGNFRTPTLITHGSLDFRVPEGQGVAFFTALRRQNVPARLVIFPDENHWVLKPGNRARWWAEMHAWLAQYLK